MFSFVKLLVLFSSAAMQWSKAVKLGGARTTNWGARLTVVQPLDANEQDDVSRGATKEGPLSFVEALKASFHSLSSRPTGGGPLAVKLGGRTTSSSQRGVLSVPPLVSLDAVPVSGSSTTNELDPVVEPGAV